LWSYQAIFPSTPKRTINSFDGQNAKDRFIERHRGGSNIAFCGARIAQEGSDALFDQRFYPIRVRVPASSWSNK
jgi:prepilin-type processing-associated H-X9-DG protein